jgi:hypothetical protein
VPRGNGPFLKVRNSPEVGYDIDRQDNFLFFIVRYQEEGQQPRMRLLRVNDNMEVAGMGIYDISYFFFLG